MGTQLMARGLVRGAAPEAWNADRPELVTAVHRSYAEAGSEAVHTNSFGGHPARLSHFGLADRCEELAAGAVRNARASGARFVIGDLGPTGEFLPPIGRGELERWREGFLRQAGALAGAGADALHVETMSDVREARLALAAAREAAAGVPVLVSLTFERKKRGFLTVMGDAAVATLLALRDAGADAVGSNCSLASPDMQALGRELLAAGVGPLVLQPNAGQPEVGASGVRYAQDPEAFAADMAPLADAGAAALGGCCGTDPRFVAALAARLRS